MLRVTNCQFSSVQLLWWEWALTWAVSVITSTIERWWWHSMSLFQRPSSTQTVVVAIRLLSHILLGRSKYAIFTYPTCIWRPRGVIPLKFHQDLWYQKTRIHWLLCRVVCMMTCLSILVELQLVMDQQTHGHSVYCTGIASHGYNYHVPRVLTNY